MEPFACFRLLVLALAHHKWIREKIREKVHEKVREKVREKVHESMHEFRARPPRISCGPWHSPLVTRYTSAVGALAQLGERCLCKA